MMSVILICLLVLGVIAVLSVLATKGDVRLRTALCLQMVSWTILTGVVWTWESNAQQSISGADVVKADAQTGEADEVADHVTILKPQDLE